ncbi:MAG TPA: hypothetical protein VJQ59_05015 [Candidatus Sulfotelmatobacter sp.]|nr:hypothetical protein [Candidatus Sulfotelmatobacter sp.]
MIALLKQPSGRISLSLEPGHGALDNAGEVTLQESHDSRAYSVRTMVRRDIQDEQTIRRRINDCDGDILIAVGEDERAAVSCGNGNQLSADKRRVFAAI